MIFSPDKAAIDVIIIGPKNQARGIFKYSAIIALGIKTEIIKTEN